MTSRREFLSNAFGIALVSGTTWPIDGQTLHLKRGDVVVQNDTRHACRNRGTKPVTMLFFLNGATP